MADRLSAFYELDAELANARAAGADLGDNHRPLVTRALNDLCWMFDCQSDLRHWFGNVKLEEANGVTLVPGMMHRVTLLKFFHFEVRAHVFEDSSETFVHNHGQHFYSRCLSGGYHHTLWEVRDGSGGSGNGSGGSGDGSGGGDEFRVGMHFSFKRTQGGKLSAAQQCKGQLCKR